MSMVCLLETCQLFDTRFLVEMRSRIAQRARYPVLHVSPGPAFDIWLMLMRATAASNAARTRASSKLATAAICAFRIASPQLMVLFATLLAGFSGRSHGRAFRMEIERDGRI